MPRSNHQNKHGPVASPLPAEVVEVVADDGPENNEGARLVPAPAESPDVARAEG